jgi:putative membrane protein
MKTAAQVLIALIALEHLWFFVFESFLWRTPLALKAFQMTPEQAEHSHVLAQNQGVYNALLAAGLVWGLLPGTVDPLGVQTFFLGAVLVAGIVGGATAKSTIFFVQGLPALIALGLVWGGRAA